MNRTKCNAIETAVMSVLQGSDNPALRGLTISPISGSFGSDDFKLRIGFSEPISEETSAAQTDDDARFGLLKPGTEVVVNVGRGIEQKGTIVASRRIRYLIRGVGGKYDGKEFTYPFSGTKLAK